MEIVPEIHLEEWDTNNARTMYIKNNLKITVEGDKNILSICDENGIYRRIKEIKYYWELQSLDFFLNSEFNDDITSDIYQREFSTYIRSIYVKYEYLIINRINNSIFGVNDLFDCDGWTNKEVKKMWDKGIIDVIDINDIDDIYPLILKDTGWEEIQNIDKDLLLATYRDISIEDLI